MAEQWASRWSVRHDVDIAVLTLTWSDEDGEHISEIVPPTAGLKACEARFVTPARHDLLCGRVTGHTGSHVSIDRWRTQGAVAL